jgi:hypothetical protein
MSNNTAIHIPQDQPLHLRVLSELNVDEMELELTQIRARRMELFNRYQTTALEKLQVKNEAQALKLEKSKSKFLKEFEKAVAALDKADKLLAEIRNLKIAIEVENL